MKLGHIEQAAQKAKLAAVGGHIEFYDAGGVAIVATGIPALTQIEQHVHPYDHLSVLVSGHVHVVVDGVDHEMKGTGFITVQANKKHTIIAETDSLWLCIHNTDRLEADE